MDALTCVSVVPPRAIEVAKHSSTSFLLSPKGFFKSKGNNQLKNHSPLLKNHNPLLKNHNRRLSDYCDTVAEVVIRPERCLRRGKTIKAERCVHWGRLKQRTKESPGWWSFGCRFATSLSFCMCLFGLGWWWYRCWPQLIFVFRVLVRLSCPIYWIGCYYGFVNDVRFANCVGRML